MILHLIHESGGGPGQQYEMEEGSVLLGRAQDAGIRFDSAQYPGVSTRHAIVEVAPGGFALEDRQSTNGTFLNGKRIQRVQLQPGDVIELGPGGPKLRVAIEGLPEPAPPATRGSAVAAPQPTAAASGQTTGALSAARASATAPAAYLAAPAGGAAPRWQQALGDIGLPSFEKLKPTGKGSAGIYVLGAMAVLGIVGGGIDILFMLLQLKLGALFGMVAALAPAPFYLLLWLSLDRNDPEPPLAIVAALLWGAGAAACGALILNTAFGLVVGMAVGQAAQGATAVLSAPFVEEGFKGLGVVLIMVFFRKEFDGILDGIVYAGVIALGFAATENILYYGKAAAVGGIGGLVASFFLRGIMLPFMHAVFTSMTGIGCGISRETHNRWLRVAAPMAGYAGAVSLHMLHNGVSTLAGNNLAVTAIFYFLAEFPFFIALMAFNYFMARREAGIIRDMLAIEVSRGLLSQAQVDMATSHWRRLQWILSAGGDFKRATARRQYLRAVSKLALSYWHVSRADAALGDTVSRQQVPVFRDEVLALQGQV